MFQSAILREEGKPDAVVLASKLAAVGYKLVIRTAVGGGSGRSCFHNLHHEFLLVSGDPEFGSPQDKEYIIDPSFRCCPLQLKLPGMMAFAVHQASIVKRVSYSCVSTLIISRCTQQACGTSISRSACRVSGEVVY